jgi:eukaryotic-like serine/threonine-protein kinase
MTQAANTSRPFRAPGYRLIRILGHGAHSTLWQARHCATGQFVCIKRVVREDDDERYFQQAMNEYDIAGKVRHPNIRKVYKIRKLRRLLALREVHLVMEFCPGNTVQQARPESLPECLAVFAQVAHALHQMNGAGFVHADMKPNNIIVDPSGTARLIDLGQSCPIGTVKQRIQGTPDYIAPEQVARKPLDARTDVYNFGASLYWSLTGKAIQTVLPRPGQLQSTIPDTLKPPSALVEGAGPLLDRLVLDCVRHEPDHRPASCREVATRLGVILRKELQPHQER